MEDPATYDTTLQHDSIRFQRNWNNKLNCDYFTSIRMNGAKYQLGKTLKLFLHQNGVYRNMGNVKVVEAKPIRMHQLNRSMTLLDAGLEIDKFKEMLWFMYKDRVPDLDKVEFVFLILEKQKNTEKQAQLFGD
jgi:hypothetical protein